MPDHEPLKPTRTVLCYEGEEHELKPPHDPLTEEERAYYADPFWIPTRPSTVARLWDAYQALEAQHAEAQGEATSAQANVDHFRSRCLHHKDTIRVLLARHAEQEQEIENCKRAETEKRLATDGYPYPRHVVPDHAEEARLRRENAGLIQQRERLQQALHENICNDDLEAQTLRVNKNLEAKVATLCRAVRGLAGHARWTMGGYPVWKRHQEAIAIAEEKKP